MPAPLYFEQRTNITLEDLTSASPFTDTAQAQLFLSYFRTRFLSLARKVQQHSHLPVAGTKLTAAFPPDSQGLSTGLTIALENGYYLFQIFAPNTNVRLHIPEITYPEPTLNSHSLLTGQPNQINAALDALVINFDKLTWE